MNHRFPDLMRRWQFPLFYAALSAPVSVIIFTLVAPQHLIWGWLFPVIYLLLCMPAPLIPGTFRRVYGIVAAILLAGVGFLFVYPITDQTLLYLVPLGYGAIILPTIPTASYGPEEGPPKALLWVGMFQHCAQFILLRYSRLGELFPRTPVAIAMTVVFLLFFFSTLSLRNRVTLYSAATGRDTIPIGIRKRNFLLLLVFFVAALVFSAIPGMSVFLVQVLVWLWKLFDLVTSLISFGKSTGDTTQSTTEFTEPEEDPGLPLLAEPNAFLESLEPILAVVFRYLIIFTLVAFGIVLLVILARTAKRLMRWSISAISYYHTASAEDYEDEITDTRTAEDASGILSAKDRVGRFMGARKLTPREQIRRRYQRLLKKNPQWQSSSTARENLSDDRSVLYEQARYSDKEITQNEAEEFVSKTKRL